MKSDVSLVRRLSLPFLTVLTLAVLLISPNLPMTRAENSTIMQAVAPQTAPNLQFSINCNSNDVVLGMSGDGPFEVQGYGPGLPASPVDGPTLTLPGPANWLNVRLIELGGDLEFINLGDLICPALPNRPIELTTQCGSDDELVINFTSLDTPGRMEGNYFGLPAGYHIRRW